MVEPVARIRAFEASDDKQVRFVIGKANLESLAIANRRGVSAISLNHQFLSFDCCNLASVHPLTISLWVALSCIFVQFMQWWPDSEYGFWGYLSPLPAFGSMAIPIMFLIDW